MVMACPARARLKAGPETNRAPECRTAPFLQEPDIFAMWGLMLARGHWPGAASCPDRVLAQMPIGRLLRHLQRATFRPPRFQLHRLVAECSATKACTSIIKGS